MIHAKIFSASLYSVVVLHLFTLATLYQLTVGQFDVELNKQLWVPHVQEVATHRWIVVDVETASRILNQDGLQEIVSGIHNPKSETDIAKL